MTESGPTNIPSLLTILVLGALMAAAPTLAEDQFFEHYEIDTGIATHQTVIPGFYLGGDTAEIAVLHIGPNDNRRLRVYGLDGRGWVSMLESTLSSGVLFVDVANIGGSDRLIVYENSHLSWYDPESATQRLLVEVATHYNATDDSRIPRLDITRDVNLDGLDDLLVPDIDGFWISIQMSDGSFTDAVKLGPPEPYLDEAGLDDSGLNDSLSYREVAITAFTLPLYMNRVHEMDHNQDGRNDLAFWNEDHFDVYYQNERGLFDPVARTVTTDVPFDSDGAYSRMFDFSEEGALSLLFGFNQNSKRTVLHSLRDINGDGVADLVTLTLAGRSPLRRRSLYQVHFGTPTPDGIQFARNAGTAISPRGKAGAGQPWGYASRWFEDLDGDGQVDIALREVTIGLGGMIRALAANSIGIDLEFYRMNGGIYPDAPNHTLKIRTDMDVFGKRNPYLPAVMLGDVNGDGRADLLTGRREELHVSLGVPGPELFARRPHKVMVAMPGDGEYAWLADLNKDVKQDILIHHRSSTEPHRVTTLIAR